MDLAVILPSRGLIYSKTVDELFTQLNESSLTYRVFYSHGRPIPECFEKPTTEALRGSFEALLYVEEDMVLPRGIIKKMWLRDAQAVACDYPVSGGDNGTVQYDADGKAYFTGCGLLMVKAELLQRMTKPIWRTDIGWTSTFDTGAVHFRVNLENDKHYGQQDVAFGLRLYFNNLPIEIMDETIGQRSLVTRGEAGKNEGFHEVVDRMDIVERTHLIGQPYSDFEHVTIDGKTVQLKRSHFKKLDKPSTPNYMTVGPTVLENPELIQDWLMLKD